MKVRMLETREITEVTPNVAHDLIERGKAEVYRGAVVPGYEKSVITPKGKDKPRITASYKHRQMRPDVVKAR